MENILPHRRGSGEIWARFLDSGRELVGQGSICSCRDSSFACPVLQVRMQGVPGLREVLA